MNEITEFVTFLAKERNDSPHTVKAYERDVSAFAAFCQDYYGGPWTWAGVDRLAIRGFLAAEQQRGVGKRSVARALSALRTFYRFLNATRGTEVNPARAARTPKIDRTLPVYLDRQETAELFKNADDVQGMFDRKYDNAMFNGGVFRYHPFLGGKPLEAKPGERVRIYIVNAGPNNFSSFHPIGEIWDNAWASGNPANKVTGVQTVVVGPGDAHTVDVVVESEGAYPLVTHSLTDALRGAIAVLVVKKDAQKLPLMPYVVPAPSK